MTFLNLQVLNLLQKKNPEIALGDAFILFFHKDQSHFKVQTESVPTSQLLSITQWKQTYEPTHLCFMFHKKIKYSIVLFPLGLTVLAD